MKAIERYNNRKQYSNRNLGAKKCRWWKIYGKVTCEKEDNFSLENPTQFYTSNGL